MDVKPEKMDGVVRLIAPPSSAHNSSDKSRQLPKTIACKSQKARSRKQETPLSERVHLLELQTKHQRDTRTQHAKTVLSLQAQLQTTTARAEARQKKLQAELSKKSSSLNIIMGDYYRVLRRSRALETELADSNVRLERAHGQNGQRGRALDTSRRGTELVMEELYSLRIENRALKKSAEVEKQEQQTMIHHLLVKKQVSATQLQTAQEKIDKIQTELNKMRDASRIQRCSLAVALKLVPRGVDREAFAGLMTRVARHYAEFPNGVNGGDVVRFAQLQPYPTPSPSFPDKNERAGARVIKIKTEEEEDGPVRKRRRVTECGSPMSLKRGRK